MPDALDQKLRTLPRRPGVYLFKDERGEVIYVGKAKDLAARVSSYFSTAGDTLRLLAPFLRANLADLDVIVTDTEGEALLLENTLIKKHKPRFNIRLRDDKDFYSIRIDTRKNYPRLEWVRTRAAKTNDGAMYFGPYASSRAVKGTIRVLQKLFPLRSCSDRMMRNRARPCLLYPLGRCCAPCVFDVKKEDYAALVENTATFLEGRKDAVVRLLKDKMSEASEKLEFERAAVYRDQLRSIDEAMGKENVVEHGLKERDAIGHVIEHGLALFVVLCYRDGALVEARDYEVTYHDEPLDELYYAFIQQYYNGASRVPPREILIMAAPSDQELLEEFLAGLRRDGLKVRLHAPERGDKRRVVEMAGENARQRLNQKLQGRKNTDEILEELQKKLGLPSPPRVIECVDISNISGALTVASVVVFRDGEPSKGDYRRYKILREGPPDDYAAMREVLERRFAKSVAEQRAMPDLLLLDGGKGQLNIALDIFRELKIARVGLASIAKEHGAGGGARRHGGAQDRIFIPHRKNHAGLNQYSPGLQLLRRARDEAHRFALAYHQTLRRKTNFKSILDEIPGVGPRKKAALLRHFGSVARLRAATPDQLAEVDGVTPSLAQIILKFFSSEIIGNPKVDDQDQ